MRLRLLPGLFLVRGLVREIRGIREQLTRQTDLLLRLAEQVAPAPPVVDRAVVAADTGVDYVDPTDQALILDFVARTERGTGHTPTDDEVLSYLADEKTQDLHRRLIERDQELERLAAEGRR
jgi:hypothetical protein